MSLGNSILNAVEKAGNKLPDPVTIFVILIGVVMLASLVMSSLGASVEHPVTGETIEVVNLLTGAQLQTLLVNMPAVLTGFAPLGMVLVVMIGAGIAEKTGLLAAGLRAMVSGVTNALLTPTLVFAGVMGNLAVDSGYIVMVPLGAVVFAAVGRHPIAGLAAVFAGVSAGFSANLVVTSLEPLLFGIPQTALGPLGHHMQRLSGDADLFLLGNPAQVPLQRIEPAPHHHRRHAFLQRSGGKTAVLGHQHEAVQGCVAIHSILLISTELKFRPIPSFLPGLHPWATYKNYRTKTSNDLAS